MGSWGGFSAFMVSVWSDMGDGHGWFDSIATGFVATALALSVISGMQTEGMHQAWMPVVGMVIGFIGIDRVKRAFRSAWDNHAKKRLGADTDKK